MIKAKKSLGQNFLVDENVIKNITNIVDIKNKDVLEIGPGTGNLTDKIIAQKPKSLILIEKDKTLTAELKDLDHKISLINKNDIDYLDMLYRTKFNYVTDDEIIIKLK